MCEGRAVGERTAIWVVQLVQYSGVKIVDLTLGCLVVPLRGPVMGKLLDLAGFPFSCYKIGMIIIVTPSLKLLMKIK